MKYLIIVLFLTIFSCGSGKETPLDADETNTPTIAYAKLKPKIIKKAFKLETDKHVLGCLTLYKYSDSGQLIKETGYDNEDNNLVFKFEYGYSYLPNDSLIHSYKYTEIPSYKDKQLIDYTYNYLTDSTKVTTQVIDNNQTDSTFITITRNKTGNIILESKKMRRIWKNPKSDYKNAYDLNLEETEYIYDSEERLIKKIETDKKKSSTYQTRYKYDENNQLVKLIYTSGNYKYIATYKNGLLYSEESGSEDPLSKQIYFYNNKNQEIASKLYRNNEYVYSYVTSYNKKGLEYKYEMIDEVNGDSGIWLYEYDKKGRPAFKIDLYARTSGN